MKKIVYSGVTKFVAVILFIASVVLGTLCVTDGITTYFDEETKVYYFENDFSESSYVSHLLDEPENVVFHAYHNLYYTYNNYGEPVDRDTPIEVNAETIGQNLQQRFDDFYYSDKINYFVQWNDMITVMLPRLKNLCRANTIRISSETAPVILNGHLHTNIACIC